MVPTFASETDGALRCCSTCLAVFRTSFIYCPNDGTVVTTADHDPLIDRQIGPYVVDAFLGAGGVARVYRVHRADAPHRQYALKIMLGDFTASRSMRMRFAREIDA